MAKRAGRQPPSWVARRCLERAGTWCLGQRVLLFVPCLSPRLSIKPRVSDTTDNPTHMCTWIQVITIFRRAPKLGGSAKTLWRDRPNSSKLRLQPRVLHCGSAKTRSMAGVPTLGNMMMIAFITIKSSLVPLIEGLCAWWCIYETPSL